MIRIPRILYALFIGTFPVPEASCCGCEEISNFAPLPSRARTSLILLQLRADRFFTVMKMRPFTLEMVPDPRYDGFPCSPLLYAPNAFSPPLARQPEAISSVFHLRANVVLSTGSRKSTWLEKIQRRPVCLPRLHGLPTFDSSSTVSRSLHTSLDSNFFCRK